MSFKRGDRVEMARNDAYWGPKPAWTKVTFRIIPSDPTRVAALLSGDVDAIENIPTADFAKLKTNASLPDLDQDLAPDHLLSRRSVPRQSPFVFDKSGKPLDKNPLKDLRVRQAISKAIDRNAIRDRVMEGLAVPSSNLVPAPMFGHNPTLKPDTYDPAGARRSCSRTAGYPTASR